MLRWITAPVALALGCATVDTPAPDMLCPWQHDPRPFRDAVTTAGAELLAVDLAASRESTCAVDRFQSLWCWGQFAGRVSATPRPIDLGAGVRSIDANDRGYCAVLVDGTLACFEPQFEDIQRREFPRPVTAVAVAGHDLAVVRLDDGTHDCRNSDFPCTGWGKGETPPSLTDGQQVCIAYYGVRTDDEPCPGDPVEVGRLVVLGPTPRHCGDSRRWPDGCDDRVIGRASTDEDGCELRADGVVRCAGAHARRLAHTTGASPPIHDPYTTIPLAGPASKIVAGWSHLCALGRAGAVSCWADNGAGQAGPGPTGEHVPPRTIPGLRDIDHLAADAATVCALARDGGLWCWGDPPSRERHRMRRCSAQVPTPTLVARIRHPETVRELDVGDATACVRHQSGAVECFGDWRRPNLKTFPAQYGIVWSGEGPILDLALDEHLCVLRGEVAVCVEDQRCTKDCRDVTWLRGQMRAIDGRCADDGASGVTCWRDHDYPDTFEVPGRIAQLRAHDRRWCVRLTDGGVLCHGKEAMQQIPTTGAADLAVGRYHSCIATRTGEVGCWSTAAPDESYRRYVAPSFVTGVTDAVSVAVSDRSACARRRDGTVTCWGGDRRGELARGHLPYALDPLTVRLEEPRQ